MLTRVARTKAELVSETCDLLREKAPAGTIDTFASALFSHAPSEDIAAYTPAQLAALTESAWGRLQQRTVGTQRITITQSADDPALESLTEAVTVIEISNDDMPFLLDSVLGELTEAACEIRLVLHPILTVVRDEAGKLDHIVMKASESKKPTSQRESLIHIHIRQVTEKTAAALEAALERTLGDVRKAVTDWKPMLARLDDAIDGLKSTLKKTDADHEAEVVDFLKWLRDGNFTFLGMRTYATQMDGDHVALERVPETGLGVLSDPNAHALSRGVGDLNASSAVIAFLKSAGVVTITKSSLKSRVHRRVLMDYIGLKLFNKRGKLTGELRIVGLFTSSAYTRPVRTIPYMRQKIDSVITRAGFDAQSHSGKALINLLEGHPRDDLFQIDEETLVELSTRILALEEHPRLRVLARRDQFDRFVSVFVFVPRDRYTTDLRIRIGEYLAQAFDGEITAFQPGFPEGSLARVHFIIGRTSGVTPHVEEAALEDAVASLMRTWTDRLSSELAAILPHAEAEAAFGKYRNAFNAAYREAYDAPTAVSDIAVIDRLRAQTLDGLAGPAVDFYRPAGGSPTSLALKLYHPTTPIELSARVPVLENLGLRVIDERTYSIAPADQSPVFLHDMTLERADGVAFEFDAALDKRLEGLFLAVWATRAESDGFNVLGLTAGLDWREIALLRAYARYLRQIGIAYSQDYMWGATARYPSIAASLVKLFRTRFDPDFAGTSRETIEADLIATIEMELAEVTSLDDDQILRRFINAITSTLRTNWFRPADDGQPRDTIAFKIESRKVTALPEPKPLREIWVYGTRIEGIHTRFGKVARGGLRWSDRAQDFRTEVLGLVKAQQVKNAVIVPVGAKGGFFPKWLKPTMSRDAFFKEGTTAYEIFIASLLSVTDNLEGETVVPPPRVVRHEPDDPYLVVAADKGTATFSDTANGIAEKVGFWLGDAFASGGSAGYDHKKMGITARGAFEAVKRHFREIDTNIMATPFSVVGVGDMSGDVFGNGMLLAPTIRLIAAFDHRDIFIDPDPDMAASLAERQRLFDLPRSSWQDYNRTLISRGGGVFSRSLKSIELSVEAREALGLAQAHASPLEIMRAILKAPADLLWFGGIGTYIRSSSETNLDAGDRANDALRITALDVRAKVIGEGANLGVTQRARIEYNLAGGRCNSDAIDNSAGVNCSDIEVNIKIAFGNAIRLGQLDRPARNTILAGMTDDVAGVILRNNYLQTLAISVARKRGLEEFNQQRRLINTLEKAGRLDRLVEILPDETGLDTRGTSGAGLSRAEIAVLLAYAKLTTKEDLLLTDVPDDAYLGDMLVTYFPPPMRELFLDAIRVHRLKREIVATTLTNAMIDHGGPTIVTRVASQTGAEIGAIARAFVVARAIHGLDKLFAEIDALDNVIPGSLQLELYVRVQDLALGSIIWLTRNVSLSIGISGVIERFGSSVGSLVPELPALLPTMLTEGPQQDIQRLTAVGVPEDLAIRLAHLPVEVAIGDIVLISETSGKPLTLAAESYFAVAERFRIARLERLAHAIAVVDYYEGLALDRARGQLGDAHRAIARLALGVAGGLQGWAEAKGEDVDRALSQIAELTAAEKMTVSRFSVAAGLIADLARE